MSNLDGNKHDLIERYLMDRLSVKEKEQFAENMKDPEFQEEVQFKKDILETIEFQEDTRLKSMLQEEEKAIKQSEQKAQARLFSIRRVAAVAASVLFFVFIYWQFFTPKVDLFSDNFVPHPNSLIIVDRGSQDISDMEETFSLYDQKKYEKTLLGFEEILSEQENDDIAFYKANALLAVGKIDEAIQILQNIIENNQTDYLAPAKWNLALAYISQNKFQEAKPLLEEIKTDRFHKQKVEKLLNETVFQDLK
jgi:tetratricopeptide (TPR) repeat protein